MKKLLSLLAALAILITCCVMGIGTVATAAVESPEEDFMVFDGVLEEYVGAGGDVVIPASLGVKEIAANAFENNMDITSLVIPEGVEVVGYWSIKGCKNLESITLPYSLCELAEHCLSSAALTEVVIPGNVERIGYGAFSGCTYLEKITISYGVKEIMVLAFQATAATELIFPETVELICGTAFVNLQTSAKYKIIICNPDCEVGPYVEGSKKAQQYQWVKTNEPAFNSALHNPTFEIYVPKDSAIETYFKSDEFKAGNAESPQAKGDTYLIKTKEADYFEPYGEGWGLKEPEKNNTAQDDKDDTQDNDDEDDDKTSGSTNKNNKNDKNSSGSSQTIIEQGGDNSALIIVVAVIGGIMLLAIIVVVILAATGVLFGKKKEASASKEDIIAEYLKEQEDKAAERERIRAELLAEMQESENKTEE